MAVVPRWVHIPICEWDSDRDSIGSIDRGSFLGCSGQWEFCGDQELCESALVERVGRGSCWVVLVGCHSMSPERSEAKTLRVQLRAGDCRVGDLGNDF